MTTTLAAPDAPVRLDIFLAMRVEGLSRARASDLISEGRVRVNGRRGVKGARVGPEDLVEVEGEVAPPDWTPAPDSDVAVRVAHEDDVVLVLDKPAGAPTHPLRADEKGTVASWIVARHPELRGIGYGPREPGIVHRLDTDTSGLLLVARTADAFERLRGALQNGEIDKEYLALVAVGDGPVAPSGHVAFPIADRSRGRVVVCQGEHAARRLGARPAETAYEVVRRFGSYALVRAHVAKAARHQVRAHLATAGHPLLADALYGGPEVAGLERHALHAAAVTFTHPTDGRRMRVEAPLPSDMQTLVDRGGRGD